MNFFFDANNYGSVFPKRSEHLSKSWLATWRDIDGEIHHDILPDAQSVNEAEYMSMLMVLKHILKQFAENKLVNYPARAYSWQIDPWDMIIRGDSQLVIYQITGIYQCKKDRLRGLFLEASNIAHTLRTTFSVNLAFKWIPRKINNQALYLEKGMIYGYEEKHSAKP